MMGTDKVDDGYREAGFFGNFHTIGNVFDDDARTLFVGQVVVRIDTSLLVFGKECRIYHLANVMIEGSRTHQSAVGSNLIGYLRSQITHCDGMLECARRHLTEVAQQPLIGVRQFYERDNGDKSKRLLHKKHQRIGQQHQYGIDQEMIVDTGIEREVVATLHELDGQIGDTHGEKHHYGCLENPRS